MRQRLVSPCEGGPGTVDHQAVMGGRAEGCRPGLFRGHRPAQRSVGTGPGRRRLGRPDRLRVAQAVFRGVG